MLEKAGRVKVKLVCEQCNESYFIKALQTKLGYLMDTKKCVCGSSELTIQPIVDKKPFPIGSGAIVCAPPLTSVCGNRCDLHLNACSQRKQRDNKI